MNDDLRGQQADRDQTVICTCLQRTEAEIRDAVRRQRLETFEDVAAMVLAGTGCTTCRPDVETILEEILESGESTSLPEEDGEPGIASAAGRPAPDHSST